MELTTAEIVFCAGSIPAEGSLEFTIMVICQEQRSCTPWSKLIFRNGRLREVRLEFNTDPESTGCDPFEFDWTTFDGCASLCSSLTMVTMCVDEDASYVSSFAGRMYLCMPVLQQSKKIKILYYPEGANGRQTWIPPPVDDTPENATAPAEDTPRQPPGYMGPGVSPP